MVKKGEWVSEWVIKKIFTLPNSRVQTRKLLRRAVLQPWGMWRKVPCVQWLQLEYWSWGLTEPSLTDNVRRWEILRHMLGRCSSLGPRPWRSFCIEFIIGWPICLYISCTRSHVISLTLKQKKLKKKNKNEKTSLCPEWKPGHSAC